MNKTHISALLSKHAHIETLIDRESQRPLPDARRVADLKKEKLRLKDALSMP